MSTRSRSIAILFGAVLLLATAGIAYGGPNNFADAELKAELSGANEVPPVASEASGEAKFEVDEAAGEIRFELEFAGPADLGLLGVAGAHIHCAPEGENGPVVVFLAGAIPGGVDGAEIKSTLTEDNIVNETCGSTFEELVASMRAGQTYVNVHSEDNPSGEIRGQIVPS